MSDKDRQKHITRSVKWNRDNPERRKEICKKSNQKNKLKISLKVKEKRWQLKLDIIKGYGGKCICCEETIPEFLTIDHKNNDGAEDRKKNGRRSHQLYLKLRNAGYPKKDHQLMCFNCNYGKYYRDKCPHKS